MNADSIGSIHQRQSVKSAFISGKLLLLPANCQLPFANCCFALLRSARFFPAPGTEGFFGQAAPAADRAGRIEHTPQGLVYGSLVGKSLGHIGLQKNQVRPFAKALQVFAPDAAFHPGKVILGAKFAIFVALTLPHRTCVPAALPAGR